MIRLQKLNSIKTKTVNIPKFEKDKIQGGDLFEELYANIFILGKKKSGKSSAIYTILKKCTNKMTTVIIFVSTVNKDQTWIEIIKYLQKKGINVMIFTSLNENGVNHIENFLKLLSQGENDEEEEKKPSLLFNEEKQEEEKEYKPKKIAPEYLIVFDDMSSELKNRFVPILLKANRHYKTKVIISSQYFNDLPKDARMQIDYMLLFPNIPLDKLQSTYTELDLSIPLEVFLVCYKNSTKEKYNFLYLDVRQEKMRKNFSHQYCMQIDED